MYFLWLDLSIQIMIFDSEHVLYLDLDASVTRYKGSPTERSKSLQMVDTALKSSYRSQNMVLYGIIGKITSVFVLW